MKNYKFQLFQCCSIVKGYNEGIIIDFQRKIFHIFPNSILDLFEYYKNKSIYELFFDYRESKNILKNYIQYFLKNELIQLADNFDNFPSISNNITKAFKIDTVCLELSDNFNIELFDKLGVNCLKIIIYELDIVKLHFFLNQLENSKLQHIAIFIRFDELKCNDFSKFTSQYLRINEIVFFESEENKSFVNDKIFYDKLNIENVLFKKINSENDFTLNLDAFNESLHFNLIYNRTIFIDKTATLKDMLMKKTLLVNSITLMIS